jgi:hypothetical protein
MARLLVLAALLSVQPAPAPAPAPARPEPDAATPTLNERCFRLMADLAEDQDPRVRGLGRVAAQYFLGRIDAAAPGFDPETALAGEAPRGAERSRLLGQCGDAMQVGGRDFRSIGQALAPGRRAIN